MGPARRNLDGWRVRVDADSVEHGERGIPEIIASCGAGLVACEPLAADLESAFLALTRSEPPAAVPAIPAATMTEDRS